MNLSAASGAPSGLTQADLRGWLESEARRLGFDLFGVTTPDAPAHLGVYEDWLSAGQHGEMAYLASETARGKRADPRLILPECRSILVLAIRYPAPGSLLPPSQRPGGAGRFPLAVESQAVDSPDHQAPPSQTAGKIAAYAWGEDYHEVLVERLRRLVAGLEARLGYRVANRCYTDTGPLLERDLAQRAGLGWIGKNTCLIHPGMGSYFFLAEILLGIELPPDLPFPHDRCGTCTRCIDACPTGCILPDRTLDARRCISYLTIELKGAMPRDLRPYTGHWVFGCDVCQQVCPWNRFARANGDAAFAPRPGLPDPELINELALSEEQFRRKFKASPVRRAKRRGYLRNVAIAMGNRIDARFASALIHALYHDPEPLVRSHAAWALGRMGSKEAYLALRQALEVESDESAEDEIRDALAGMDSLKHH